MQEHERREPRSLILSEQTFPIIEQITAGMPGGFFIYHADGDEGLIYANQALIRIFGCGSLEEFQQQTGYTFPGMIHPEDLDAAQRSIRQQVFGFKNDMDYVEYRIVRRDGEVRWIEDYGHFVHSDTYGDLFYVFVEDATEKHQRSIENARTARLAQERLKALEDLEHETTALRMVHELLRSGMWSMKFDREGEMTSVHWSPEFRAMIGYKDERDFPNELSAWTSLLHPDDCDRVLEHYFATIEDYSGKSIYNIEYRLLTKDRGYRWFRATGKLSRREDGTPITYVGMFVDITESKENDEKIVEQQTLPEGHPVQSERDSGAEAPFANSASHDIRTPMNAIIGFANLAAAHLDDLELAQDYLNKISASSNQLLGRINDMLDMNRIASGTVVIEEVPCSLSQMLRDLQAMVQPDVDAKDLVFYLDDSALIHPNVMCDVARLSQVLLNVLSNAIKFTPAWGCVAISAAERPGESPDAAVYEFCIQDNGIGMAPEFVEHIFESFEREQTSAASSVEGAGLGLHITKKLTELMNGQIAVESSQGFGSTFTITFPFRLYEGAEEQKTADVPVQRVFTGHHLLLVEDNELNQEIALSLLEEAGYFVDVAANGEEAVERVLNSLDDPYDLILMDIQMPVMDGLEATRAIRAMDDPRLSELPIVAVTANTQEEDRKRVLSAGMNGHLGKPIDMDQLLAKLQDMLGSAPSM